MRYEDIEVFSFNTKALLNKKDVWTINREYWKNQTKTPTKLPSKVIEKCISYTTQEGDFVFDPFLGSGQVAVVADRMKRKYCGFEICPEYWNLHRKDYQKKWISQSQIQFINTPTQ